MVALTLALGVGSGGWEVEGRGSPISVLYIISFVLGYVVQTT